MKIEEIAYVEEMRQRLGLEKDDTRKDKYIESLDQFQRVGLIVGWFHGSESWASKYKEYFESQGIYLTTNADADGII